MKSVKSLPGSPFNLNFKTDATDGFYGQVAKFAIEMSHAIEHQILSSRYDEEHGIRDAFKTELEKVQKRSVSCSINQGHVNLEDYLIDCIQKFGHLGLQFAKGGQISIDCFPTGSSYSQNVILYQDLENRLGQDILPPICG